MWVVGGMGGAGIRRLRVAVAVALGRAELGCGVGSVVSSVNLLVSMTQSCGARGAGGFAMDFGAASFGPWRLLPGVGGSWRPFFRPSSMCVFCNDLIRSHAS